MFQLNKVNTDTNRNTCRKFCEFNSDGSPKTAGNSHSSLTSSYTSKTGDPVKKVYSGDVVNFSCNSNNPCGTSKGLTIVGRCLDTGWTIESFQCKTCDGCNNSSGIGFDEQNTSAIDGPSCTVEAFKMKCMLEKAITANQVPAKSHNQTIIIENQYCDDCKICSASYCIQGRAKYLCSDGTWLLSGQTDDTANFRINGDCTAW
jgi:hypothetical protein